MDVRHSDLLDRARGLAAARALIERAVVDLINEATATDIDVTALAHALRIHRSTVYRSAVHGIGPGGSSFGTHRRSGDG
jgi:DNA-binding IclR family transcriptional regulator